VTNRFARNQTVWCRVCNCYRNKALDAPSLCQVCRRPHAIVHGGWQHFTAVDPKTDDRIVVFVSAHYADAVMCEQMLARLRAKHPALTAWQVEWRNKAEREPREAFQAGL
jgi:hypothetical protein